MDFFHYKNNELYAEQVPLRVIAERFGTPCYVYSRASIETAWKAFDQEFSHHSHRICYAVKANSNIAILNLLAKLQSGFDIVSLGELERVLAAKGDPKKIVFSGVGKTDEEIARAIDVDIYCFNVECEAELEKLNSIAKQKNKKINIALRINPNIDAKTHPYIATGLHQNKFGLELKNIPALCEKIKNLPHLNLVGIGCHIGSQLTELDPFLEALDCLVELAEKISALGIPIKSLDIGGGLGIRYRDENPPKISDYLAAIHKKMHHLPYEIILEPGRVIVGNAGILLTRVEYLKHTENKNFAIVDAGMNDLIRPALYDAWQDILPVVQSQQHSSSTAQHPSSTTHHPSSPRKRGSYDEIPAFAGMTDVEVAMTDGIIYDIVGPVCESADFLGKNRKLTVEQNDLLAICSAGAYGFSMSSNYNSRPRPAEVLVDNDKVFLIRERETIQDLFKHEKLI